MIGHLNSEVRFDIRCRGRSALDGDYLPLTSDEKKKLEEYTKK